MMASDEQICVNCEYFEAWDDDGDFPFGHGRCGHAVPFGEDRINPLFGYVVGDESCYEFEEKSDEE